MNRLPNELEYLHRKRSHIDHAVFAGFLHDSGNAVYLQEDDRRVHTYAVGVSGSGKSRFLQALIFQDIAKGHPLCLIDPMGDLYTSVRDYLARCIEKASTLGIDLDELLQKYVFLDLKDEQNPVRINPLEPQGSETSEHQVDDLLKALERLLGNMEERVRLRNILKGAFMMIAELNRLPASERPMLPRDFRAGNEYPLNLFFATDYLNMSNDERAALLAALPETDRLRFRRQYATFFAGNPPAEQSRLIQSSMNVLQYLLDDSMVLGVLNCHQSTVHIEDILRTGKTLLCRLPIGENLKGTEFLGRFITTKIQHSAYRRPQAEWSNAYYLYLDEFHQFVDQAFADAMTNLRKYGIRLINAHQSQSQPPFDTAEGQALLKTIKGNSRIKGVFRLDRPDAETMAKELFPVTTPQISHYEVAETESYAEQRATNIAFSFTATEGTANTWSRSKTHTLGTTRTLGIGRTFGTNIGKTLTEGIGASLVQGLAHAITKSESKGITEVYNEGLLMSVALGENWSQVRDHRRGLTLTQGENGTFAVQRGQARSESHTDQQGATQTSGRNQQQTSSEGTNLVHGENGSIAYFDDGQDRDTTGRSSSVARIRNVAQTQGENHSNAISSMRGVARGLTDKRGTSLSKGRKLDRGISIGDGTSTSDGGSRTVNRGQSLGHSLGQKYESGSSETDTESLAEGQSWQVTVANAFSLLDQVSKTYSEALQDARAEMEGLSRTENDSLAHGEQVGGSEALSHTAGMTRRPIYRTLEEKRERAVNQLQSLDNRHCLVSTVALQAKLLETPFVADEQYPYLTQDFPGLMIELQRERLLSDSAESRQASGEEKKNGEQTKEGQQPPPGPDDDEDDDDLQFGV